MKCSTSKASTVADWSFSSSLTSPRQKSDEMTSVGRKTRRAKVDLPEPDGPINTTSESSGMVIFTFSWAKDRHLGRRAQRCVLTPDGQEPRFVAEAFADAASPMLEFIARPFEAMVTMTKAARGQAL